VVNPQPVDGGVQARGCGPVQPVSEGRAGERREWRACLLPNGHVGWQGSQPRYGMLTWYFLDLAVV
jgi:hypothetical protein